MSVLTFEQLRQVALSLRLPDGSRAVGRFGYTHELGFGVLGTYKPHNQTIQISLLAPDIVRVALHEMGHALLHKDALPSYTHEQQADHVMTRAAALLNMEVRSAWYWPVREPPTDPLLRARAESAAKKIVQAVRAVWADDLRGLEAAA